MPRAAFRWLYILFFFSGFPALIYQIVWQRTLFAIYGVNIESVTIVVSAFMLGLGLGSLLGGRISQSPTAPLLLLFGGIELGIAVYGMLSLPLFHWVAGFTAGAPPLETGLLSFALVLVPTVLMGATLPLLVAQLVKLSGNVGRAVGALYFVNTLGSAVACFAAALVTMRYLGMSGSVAVAATLNTLVAGAVLALHFAWRGRAAAGGASSERGATEGVAGASSEGIAIEAAGGASSERRATEAVVGASGARIAIEAASGAPAARSVIEAVAGASAAQSAIEAVAGASGKRSATEAAGGASSERSATHAAKAPRTRLRFGIAIVLAAMAGFISLIYEIVWYRLYSFASGGPAQCFAYVLGAFLTGIAFGSLLSRRICNRPGAELERLARFIAVLVLAASILGFAVVPIVAEAVIRVSYFWTLPLVALTAGMLGATFPLICHISVPPDARAGAGLSYLYLANIIGSAAGCWLVGFILMDYWPLRWISVFVALLGIAFGTALLNAARLGARDRAGAAVIIVTFAVTIVLSSGPLFAEVYRKMDYKRDWAQPGARLVDVIENRSGVITVDADAAIFGGGVFDGWIETDVHVTDTVVRALALSFYHPDPEEVLIVGMSGGAWSQVIANHPQVRKVTVIEINPGYAEVMRRCPVVAPVLTNRKVELVIDDGRRWMFRHRDRRFDMIVMDTIYHWRAHATNLLSVEFLNLARGLLKPGGILYYNTTSSPEAQRTGALHFPYAYRFGIFMAVSDSPIQVSTERWRETLLRYRLEGLPIIDAAQPDDRSLLREILCSADTLPGDHYDAHGMESRENILRRTRGRPVITDDNMATEWRGYVQ